MLTERDVRRLAEELGSPRVERALNADDKEQIREAICAFANDLSNSQRPGYVLFGVESARGELIGVPGSDQLLADIAALRNDAQIIPIPNMVVDRVSLEDGKQIVYIEVHPSDSPPLRVRGRTLVRTGRRKGIATPSEERTLSERRLAWARTFDHRPCLNATLGDLDLDLFRRLYQPAMLDPSVLNEEGRSTEEQLASLRFLALASGRPTYGGILAIGTEPRRFIPGAYIDFVRYDGTDPTSPVLESRELTGNVRILVQEAVTLLERNIRPSNPDYPLEALRELLLNAIAHRNYETSKAPITLRWFSDRIELQNPGGLYGAVRRENFDAANDYRNPVVAEATKGFGFVERFGSGISLARAALRRNGNPPADWVFEWTHTLAVVRAK